MKTAAGAGFLVCLAVAAGGCGAHRAAARPPEPSALERERRASESPRSELPRAEMEWMTDDSREKAIADYERIIEDYAEVAPDEMDDALYHLEHLLFERERRAFEDAQQVYESRREQADATGTAAPPEPKPRYPAARAIAERLVREFPDSSLAEDALYDLGYMQSEEGDRAGASAVFERLARENPRSRYAPEAHFRVAEYAFETNRLVDAEKHYVLALRRGVTGFTDKALFKLGWIYHDLRRPDEAKRTLSMLLERQVREIEAMGAELAPLPSLFFPAPRRSEIPDARRRSIDDVYPETLEALARVYAEAGGAAALLDFVNGHDRDGEPPRYAAPLLHRLALAQREHASFAAAADTYRLLLERFPSARDAPQAEAELAELFADQGELDEAARVREQMVERYGAGSAWARANPEEERRSAAVRSAARGLAASSRDLHARGLELQKERGGVPEELRRAVALYENYLNHFADEDESYEARFRYAQALFAVGDYAKAAEAFRLVAFDTRRDVEREPAAFSRILSIMKLAGDRDPLPPAFVESIVAACEDHLSLNPQSDNSAKILFKEAEIYARAGKDAEAIAVYGRLARERPADPLAAEASVAIAEAELRGGDFAGAEQSSAKALASAGPGTPLAAWRSEIEDLHALAIFERGEEAEKDERLPEAAEHYLRLVDRLPESPVSVRALYNAGAVTEEAGDRMGAAALFERLTTRYPQSDLAPEAAVRLAELSNDAPGGSERILHAYEEVADHRVESPRSEELLFLAAKLAAKENRSVEAVRLFGKFLARYPSTGPDERGRRNLEALYRRGVANAEAGRPIAARDDLERFLSRPLAAAAGFGDNPQAYPFAVARAHLILGDIAAEDYFAVRIVAPVADSLRRKRRLLDDVLARYMPAMTSGLSPIATQAAYRMGKAYEQFAAALLDAPRPPALTVEEQGEYGRLLREKARPYLRSAVDVYRASLRAARESSLADEWVARSRERLAAVAALAFLREPRPAYLRIADAAAAPAEASLPRTSSREELDALLARLSHSPPRLVDLGILAAERGAADLAAKAFAGARAGVASSDLRNLAIVLNDHALATLAAGDAAGAEALAAASRQAAPDLAAAANTAGMIEMQRGNFEAAEREFRAAIATDGTLGVAWANLGILQELYFAAPDEALDSYRRYLATRPLDRDVVAGWVREVEERNTAHFPHL